VEVESIIGKMALNSSESEWIMKFMELGFMNGKMGSGIWGDEVKDLCMDLES
jgi:hypothetical protein